MPLFLQVSPGGATLTAKRHTLQYSTGFIAIAWRSNTTARRYTSTCVVLVLKHPKQSEINHTLIIMHIHNQEYRLLEINMTPMHNLNLNGFIIHVHKYHHISYASIPTYSYTYIFHPLNPW